MTNKIIDTARDLLNKCNAYKLPVDLNMVTDHLNIKVIKDSFDDDVSGLLVIKNGKVAIGINRDHGDNRRRFTIAHEIGHYLLHHKKEEQEEVFVDRKWAYFRDKKSHKGIDKKEIEANNFAAELIMPAELLINYVKENDIDLFDDFAIYDLSQYLEVSEEALTIRLIKLGFIEPY